jgi:hypothetical protein
LQREVSDLKQKNEFLVMENGKLQQQCDEALAVVNGMENVCAQNKQFASELRLVKTERDELSRRVQILVQTTSELQLQLEDARNQKPKVMPDQWRDVQVIPCDHEEKIQQQQQDINNLKSILTKEQRKSQEVNSIKGM